MEHVPDNIKNYDFFLWKQLKQGDKKALHKIYTGHYAGMMDYGLRLTDNRSYVRACIQQVFRDLISRLDQLNPVSHIRFYLLYALRQHIFEQTTNGKPSKINFQQVNEAAGLNFREKEAMYLKFHQGLDDFEISRMIGLTNGAARELLFSALQKYRTRRDAPNPH